MQWIALGQGLYKINFSAAVDLDRRFCGVCVVKRDWRGEFYAGLCKLCKYVVSVDMAEFTRFVIMDLNILNTNCYLVLGWLIYGVLACLIFLLTFNLLLGLNIGFFISSFILIMFLSMGSRLLHCFFLCWLAVAKPGFWLSGGEI